MAGVVWFVALAALLYAYWLVMADFVIRNYWDPGYAYKFERLKACVAAYPQHPLWLVFGSSRVMVGFRPDILAGRLRDKDAPLVFNFGMGGASICRQYIYFRRVLADGLKPQKVGIEIFGADFSRELYTFVELPYMITHAREKELPLLQRFGTTPPDFTGIWRKSRWDPMFEFGMIMGHQTLSWRLIPIPGIERMEERPYDPWGWVFMGMTTSEAEYRQNFVLTKVRYEGDFKDYKIRPNADLVLRAFLDDCRARGISTFILRMPETDDFRAFQSPAGAAKLEQYIADIHSQYKDVPVIDASRWIERDGFGDGHHLNGAGAALFTKRFGEELAALDR